MENNIKIALAGRAAEELVFGYDNITTGAANDIERATQIILNMAKTFGMDSDIGLINYDVLRQNGIAGMHEDIIGQCKRNLSSIYEEVKKLLQENRAILDKIASELLHRETIYECELDSIIHEYGICA